MEPDEKKNKDPTYLKNFPWPEYMIRVGKRLEGLEESFANATISCLEEAKEFEESPLELFIP